MAKQLMMSSLCFALISFLLISTVSSRDLLGSSPPSPSPAIGSNGPEKSPSVTKISSAAPSPDLRSPSAPSPSGNKDGPSPSLPPTTSPGASPSASPVADGGDADDRAAPEPVSDAADIGHHEKAGDDDVTEGKKGDEMSAGKKARIVIGVFAAVGVVGIVGIVIKKRQQNMRRAQYGASARGGGGFL